MNTIPLTLNLTQFLQTGKFGFIPLGISKSELETQGFPPEDWGGAKSKAKAGVWRYGNFELHFDREDRLKMIFNDYLDELDGGQSIKIEDYWILEHGTPTILEVMASLNNLDINFSRKSNEFDQILLTTEHGITMSFEDEDGACLIFAISQESHPAPVGGE
ncbi:hypothetical protein [Pontibacter sp. G13]|uniref:hypothetical protein n=1 Tax=Pontibacter sp. G13 TaxID=3074898 RepID=UPI002889B7EB|nr:hypothetical protein [Pontibacter sp. G13]WNJ16897.1 hypothetical protein RJD25_18695 [Pontibacter sp. G13]